MTKDQVDNVPYFPQLVSLEQILLLDNNDAILILQKNPQNFRVQWQLSKWQENKIKQALFLDLFYVPGALLKNKKNNNHSGL